MNTINKSVNIVNTGEIAQSAQYFEARADTIITVSTNVEGDEVTTFIFLDNYPLVGYQDELITVTGIEKKRVASITVSSSKARKLYEALRDVYEDK